MLVEGKLTQLAGPGLKRQRTSTSSLETRLEIAKLDRRGLPGSKNKGLSVMTQKLSVYVGYVSYANLIELLLARCTCSQLRPEGADGC